MSQEWDEMWLRIPSKRAQNCSHTDYDVAEIARRWQPNNLDRAAAFSPITGRMRKCTSFK